MIYFTLNHCDLIEDSEEITVWHALSVQVQEVDSSSGTDGCKSWMLETWQAALSTWIPCQQRVEPSTFIPFVSELKHPSMSLLQLFYSSLKSLGWWVQLVCGSCHCCFTSHLLRQSAPQRAGVELAFHHGHWTAKLSKSAALHEGKQAGASGTVSVGIARSFIPVKPTERVLVLGKIVFELRQLWVRQCQTLSSIVSVPSDAAFLDELPAQNAELILKQVFHPRKKIAFF